MFIKIPANKQSKNQRKPLCGKGLNDASYQVNPIVNGKKLTCQFYMRWHNMIKRCYSPEYHRRFPTYKGCSVCDDWLVFSKFKCWMKTQNWKGKQLDKDLLISGNKIYSPDTCLFVSEAINSLILHNVTSKNGYPQGVHVNIKSGLYIAQCRNKGSVRYLGRFKTAELASKAYKAYKYKLIKVIANQQVEPLKSALLDYRITN